ncbi:MAG: hypothetical protein IJ561_00885 [Ruminococcus sp.]|nr:hypothetical protein [Ruminococcus sp.]
MKKQLLSLTLAALMLTACSGSDSSTAAAGADLSAVEVKNAYNGAEELMGKDYGKFSMPSAFEVPTLTNVYTIDYNTVPPKYDREKLKKLYVDFFGDKFDERGLADDGTWGLYYTAPHEVDENGAPIGGNPDTAIYFDGYLNLAREQDLPLYTEGDFTHYFVDNSFDQSVTVDEMDTTIAQQAAFLDNKMNTLFEGFFTPFELKTNAIDIYTNGTIDANVAFALDGITLQSWKGDFENIIEDKGTEVYDTFQAGAMMNVQNDVRFIYTANIPTLVEKHPVDRIISLKRAVGILQSDLPDNASYNFTDVRLMYCCKVLFPRTSSVVTDSNLDDQRMAEYNSSVRTLEPMWCFFVEKPDEYIGEMIVKVNAITGELDLDIATENQ